MPTLVLVVNMVFIYMGRKAYRSIKKQGNAQPATPTKPDVTNEKATKEIVPQSEQDHTASDATPSISTCGHQFDKTAGSCPTCKSTRRAQRKYRLKVMFGLVLPFVLQALDVTIVSPAASPWDAPPLTRFCV